MRLRALIFFLPLLASMAAAQDFAAFNVAVTGNYYRTSVIQGCANCVIGPSPTASANTGGLGRFELFWRSDRHWGFAVDAGFGAGLFGPQARYLLFGPELTARSRLSDEFIKLQVGDIYAYRGNQAPGVITSSTPVGNAAGYEFGGGVDAHFTHRFSVRVMEFDVMRSRLRGSWYTDYTAGAGIVFRLGPIRSH